MEAGASSWVPAASDAADDVGEVDALVAGTGVVGTGVVGTGAGGVPLVERGAGVGGAVTGADTGANRDDEAPTGIDPVRITECATTRLRYAGVGLVDGRPSLAVAVVGGGDAPQGVAVYDRVNDRGGRGGKRCGGGRRGFEREPNGGHRRDGARRGGDAELAEHHDGSDQSSDRALRRRAEGAGDGDDPEAARSGW